MLLSTNWQDKNFWSYHTEKDTSHDYDTKGIKYFKLISHVDSYITQSLQ